VRAHTLREKIEERCETDCMLKAVARTRARNQRKTWVGDTEPQGGLTAVLLVVCSTLWRGGWEANQETVRECPLASVLGHCEQALLGKVFQ
jgi:hypothetical protein